jgi:hypothetical protein
MKGFFSPRQRRLQFAPVSPFSLSCLSALQSRQSESVVSAFPTSTSRPVMNSPAKAEARDRAHAAPLQSHPGDQRRGETGQSSGPEAAQPVIATAPIFPVSAFPVYRGRG